VAGNGGGLADGSEVGQLQRGGFLADDHHARSSGLGPASFGQPDPVDLYRERALTVVHTLLSQLRDLDPEHEPMVFQATRLRARQELDAIDCGAETSRPSAPRTREAREQSVGHHSGSAPSPLWRRVLARLRPSSPLVSVKIRARSTDGRRSRGRHHRRSFLQDGGTQSLPLVGRPSAGMRIHTVPNATPKHSPPSAWSMRERREPVAVSVRRPQRAVPLRWLISKSS
jgi:hypothetical protein